MNRKIIAIGIIGMFLLTGLTALSVGGKEAVVQERSSKETGELVVFIIWRIGDIPLGSGVKDATVTATAKDGSGNYTIPAYVNHGINCYYHDDIPGGDYEVTATKGDWTRTNSSVIIKNGWQYMTEVEFRYSILSIANLPSTPLMSLLHQILAEPFLLR